LHCILQNLGQRFSHHAKNACIQLRPVPVFSFHPKIGQPAAKKTVRRDGLRGLRWTNSICGVQRAIASPRPERFVAPLVAIRR
jgi:hypothetical protein